MSKRHRRRGMSLPELLVSMALFSVVSLVTLQLYLSAYTEFEHSSGTMTLNQRARTTVDRITQVLKTAAPVLNNNAEAFIHPNLGVDLGKDMYEADFCSTICFIPNSTLAATAWAVTDQASAAYVADSADPRWIYETDQGLTAAVSRQPSLYRYRIAWNYLTTPLAGQRSNVQGRSVYMERLHFADTGGVGPLQGPDSATYFLSPQIADTGTPYGGAAMRPRILGRNVHYLTFTRSQGNIILLRLKMYNRDPVTNVPVEGMTFRRPSFGGSSGQAVGRNARYFIVDLVTNIQLPNTI